jgi:hypothetical protein
MLLALLLLVQTPVTVRLKHDQFTAGDQARVYVRTEQDGYLVVLHADPEGRIRVLFPLDPSDDDFVRGGKKFEVRGRGDRDAFQIESSDGSGTVLAAVAPDAFKFDSFVRNDHWDFRALGSPSGGGRDDPLARVVDIVQKMSGDSAGHFDYDYATYVVNSREIAARYGYGSRYGFYPYHFGYYDPFCYDPFFFGVSSFCYGAGFGFGFRGGYGFGFGPPIYRPYRPYRPYIFSQVPGPRFLIPNRPTRYTPTPVRPRDLGRPNVAPRITGSGPGPSRGQPRIMTGGSRPTISRGFGGGSRPASRPSGGGGGGGGRRH